MSLLKAWPLILGMGFMTFNDTGVLFDFETASEANGWMIVNDGVMGGISRSRLEIRDGRARFYGTVSLENNGGFASTRVRLGRSDLSGYSGFLLRVKGDGKRYKLRLRTNSTFDGVAYSADFQTRPGEWQTVRIPAETLRPTFRGRLVTRAPRLKMAGVRQLGFLISDGQAGPFALEIDWIKVYKP